MLLAVADVIRYFHLVDVVVFDLGDWWGHGIILWSSLQSLILSLLPLPSRLWTCNSLSWTLLRRLLLCWLGRRGLLLLTSHHLLQLILILLSEYAGTFFALGYQVIAGCQVIELILLHIILALLGIYTIVLVQQLHDLVVNGDLVAAHDDALFFVGFYLVVPGVVSNVLYGEAAGWIWIQDAGDQILGFIGEEAG